MSPRVEPKPVPLPDSGSEMAKMTVSVAKWGLEAGFLGLEDRLEPRLAAMVREAAMRLFGNFEAETARLRSEMETAETEWQQAALQIAAWRSRLDRPETSRGWIKRLCSWVFDFREYRTACARHDRNEPVFRSKRQELATAELKARQANEWCEVSLPALRAHYEFEKARAASLRPEQEIVSDTRETRQFVVHRAN